MAAFEYSMTENNDRRYHITAEWDPEAEVWVAVSDQVPGLVAEAGSMNELVSELNILVPELLEANGVCEAVDVDKNLIHVTSELDFSIDVAAAN